MGAAQALLVACAELWLAGLCENKDECVATLRHMRQEALGVSALDLRHSPAACRRGGRHHRRHHQVRRHRVVCALCCSAGCLLA